MPAPATCIVSGTLYDASGVALPNTLVVLSVPQQVIGGTVVAATLVSTRSGASGAITPIALPQTAVVAVTIGGGGTVMGIVPAAATGTLAGLLSGTVFEGSLSGATIQANGVNLQSQLILNFTSSYGVEVGNPSGGLVTFRNAPILNGNATETHLVSDASEQQIHGGTLVGGTLGANGNIFVNAGFYVDSMLNGATLTLKHHFGSSLFFAPVLTNGTGSTQTGFAIWTKTWIHGRNDVGQQAYFAKAQVATVNSALNFGTSGLLRTFFGGGLSVDTSVNKTFVVNGLWSASSVSNDVYGLGFDVR